MEEAGKQCRACGSRAVQDRYVASEHAHFRLCWECGAFLPERMIYTEDDQCPACGARIYTLRSDQVRYLDRSDDRLHRCHGKVPA